MLIFCFTNEVNREEILCLLGADYIYIVLGLTYHGHVAEGWLAGAGLLAPLCLCLEPLRVPGLALLATLLCLSVQQLTGVLSLCLDHLSLVNRGHVI